MSSSESWNSARCYNPPCKASLTKHTWTKEDFKIEIFQDFLYSHVLWWWYRRYFKCVKPAWISSLEIWISVTKKNRISSLLAEFTYRNPELVFSKRLENSKFEYRNHMLLIRKDYRFRIRMSRGRIKLSYFNLLCTFGPWTSWWRSCSIQLNTGNIYYCSIRVLWFSDSSNGYNSNLVFVLNSETFDFSRFIKKSSIK